MDPGYIPTMMDHMGGQYGRIDHNTDWRFLLPEPETDSFEHLVIPGGTEDLAQEILDSAMAQRVSRDLPAQSVADALVFRHDAPVSLTEAVQTLNPEGIAYIESERSPIPLTGGGLSGLANTLRSLGLKPIGYYLIRPDASNIQAYIPLDMPNPLKWYLKSLFPLTSPAKHLVSLLAMRIPQLITAFPQFSSHCAIVAAPHESNWDPTLISSNLAPPHLDIDESLTPLVLRKTDGGANRTVLFLFGPESTSPTVVLKVVSSASENSRNEHEQQVLKEIRRLLTPHFLESVPTPMGVHHWNGLAIAAESCVQGQSLSMMTRHWRAGLSEHIRSLELAASWLIEFHQQTTISREPWGDRAVNYWIHSRLEAYASALGMTPGEQKLFSMTKARAQELLGVPMPMVWAHGDFKERNVFFDDDSVSVIDWESSTPGLPLLDLLYFSTLWFHSANSLRGKSTKLQSFRKLNGDAESSDEAIDAIHLMIERYLEAVSVDPRFHSVLLVVLWVERALKRYFNQLNSNEPESTLRETNPYVEYVGVLAEGTERLFRTNLAE